jgi:hypothetical protein
VGKEEMSLGELRDARPPATAPSTSLDRAATNLRGLRQFAWIGLLLLLIQNVTGIVLNLYVMLPIPGSFGAVFVLAPVLTVHIVNALLLVAGGALLALYGWRTRVARLRAASLGALASVVVGVQEGFVFTFTQNNAFSFGMEMGFLGAVFLCGTLLFLTGPLLPQGRPA